MDSGSSPAELAEQDYRAALHELHSNIGVRRLMLVVANILVPAMLMAAADTMSGENYPDQLAWLPERILGVVGVVLTIGGLLISLVLCRCHMGMVINGTKMRKVASGSWKAAGLNWLGVTTNFVALTGLSIGLGALVLTYLMGLPSLIGVPLSVGALGLPLAVLARDHRRASAHCRRLDSSWNHGPIPDTLLEEHAIGSLDDTNNDIAVVVAMAGALFAGAFNAMSNVGAMQPNLRLSVEVSALQVAAIPALASYLTLSLLLSCRMVMRLRVAVAEHSERLAELRGEVDDPWQFRPMERTFLLYLIVVTLTAASIVITVWAWLGDAEGSSAALSGVAAFAAGLVWYPSALGLAARRREPSRPR